MMLCLLTLLLVVVSGKPWYYYATQGAYLFHDEPVKRVFDSPSATILSPQTPPPGHDPQIEGLLGAAMVRGRHVLVAVKKAADQGDVVGVKKIEKVQILPAMPGAGFIESAFQESLTGLIQAGWYITTNALDDKYTANKHLLDGLTVESAPAEVMLKAFSGHVKCAMIGPVKVCIQTMQNVHRCGIDSYVEGMTEDGEVAGSFEIVVTMTVGDKMVEEKLYRMHPPIMFDDNGGIVADKEKQKAAFTAFLGKYGTSKRVQIYENITDTHVSQALIAQLHQVPQVIHSHYDPKAQKAAQPKADKAGKKGGFFTGLFGGLTEPQVPPLVRWSNSVPLDTDHPIIVVYDKEHPESDITYSLILRLLLMHTTTTFKAPDNLITIEANKMLLEMVREAVHAMTMTNTSFSMSATNDFRWMTLPGKEKQMVMDIIYGTSFELGTGEASQNDSKQTPIKANPLKKTKY